MNYQEIKKYDTANGIGIRTSIWFSGCRFHCKGCFNYKAWDFNSGKVFDDEAKNLLFSYLSDEHVKGLSILGGEPLQQNLSELQNFIIETKEKFPNKNIWLWTGYYLNNLNDEQKKVVDLCDFVVDGLFENDKKSFKLKFRGSSNQTIWEKDKDGNFIKSKLND